MRMNSRAITYITLVLALGASVCRAAEPSPVKITGGEVVGVRADTLISYKGIPFAAPPVGNLRWQAPQPVVPWTGVKEARSFSATCAQTAVWITLPKSEDCLYLNIWAPEKATKLPVIVWIHGGGYYGGTAAQPGYDGANLAKRGAIVVTLNYRLGIFGFFAHPELTVESPNRTSGNQGILDQIAALRWVKNNIVAFGGDADRVTIVGESAGAISVAILTVSPLAKGLFQRAIAESGSDILDSQSDRKTVEAKGVAFAKTAGAKNLADLRGMSVEALHKSAWSPDAVIDDYVLREDLPTAYRNHRQNDVPLLAGWNAEEGKDLAPEILGTGDFTVTNHPKLMAKMLGYAPSDALLAAYPVTTNDQAKASMYQFTNDWWGWRTTHWAGLQGKYGRSKPYVYFFAHRPTAPLTPCGYGCGAGHGAEIPFVFDNIDQDQRPWSKADREVATRLADTWVNFARTGNPNGKGLPAWPAFDGSNASIFRIGDQDRLPDFLLFQRVGKD
ncbi:carboxylesterase/lipase family protein [Duganella sp. CT11-25]|uniref:carboxylesterase/lipase family protein n=1 Tax=unclassified Duganella TaxID=2636909 RepID=UPI0039B082CD